MAGTRVATLFVNMLVVGVLAFGMSSSFDFHVLVAAVIQVCVRVRFVSVFAVFAVIEIWGRVERLEPRC